MLYQRLGTSALHISRIGFGCMSLPNDRSSEHILFEACERGINFFDTADLYQNGTNEILVGKTLSSKRSNIIIATKGGNQWLPDGSGWKWNASPDYLRKCVEQSLMRLGTDYIDLYQLHGGTMEDPAEEIIELFDALVQEGKIRYYGISSIRPNVISRWVRSSKMVSVMMQYSLLDRRPEEQCFPWLQKHSVGVLARGSLAQGLLTGKPAKKYLGHSEENVQEIAGKLKTLSSPDRPETGALGFVLQHPAVSAAIVGIRTQQQLEQALQSVNALPLSKDKYERIEAISSPNYYDQHRM
jgi:aryl-alcohol dehydrogenase-like predicted oxidoreductase